MTGCQASSWLGPRRVGVRTARLALAVLAAAGAARAASASVGPAPRATTLPERVYEVTLEVKVDPGTRVLEGREHLRWRNTSRSPVVELQFHHYLNAFSNTRTTFWSESRAELGSPEVADDDWGFVEVTAMRTADGVDLKAAERYIQPDDGNPEDRTVARYPLPAPLPPGGSIELDIEFEGRLPTIVARTGVHSDFVLGGQWFPKIGVLEDAGVRGRAEAGWNCHQYHADSEFYADFGDYDVRIALPARYRGHIGATGRLVEERATSEEVTARFVQHGVNDFAWTADPDFVVLHDRFDPVADVPRAQQERIAALLGTSPDAIGLLPVDVTLFLQPAHRAQAGRYLSALKAALVGYGLRLGPFPYEHLTLVDPPRGGMGAAGMEYMTFITLGTHPLFDLPPFGGVRFPEAVTIHELGHNYWMGIIASNEFEEPWLDEGINSYYDMTITDELYGGEVELPGLSVSAFESNRTALAGGLVSDPIAREAWKYRSSGSYALSTYSRPAVTLHHLERLVGAEAFAQAMRAFFEAWRFRHPSTADFEASFQRSVGRDLGWFFEQALHSTRALDYAVGSATCSRVGSDRGVFWRDGRRVDKRADEASSGTGSRTPCRSEIVVERRGDFVHPVTVELTYDDGQVERVTWDGRERWHRIERERPAKLVSAVVDPERMMSLDVNRLNNGRLLEARRTPSAKLLVNLLCWLQAVLAGTALVG